MADFINKTKASAIESVEAIKHRLIDQLLLYSGILGFTGFFIITYPYKNFFTPKLLIGLAAILCYPLIYRFRHRISLNLKTYWCIAGTLYFAFSDMVTSGVISSNILLLTIVPFISIMVFSQFKTILISMGVTVAYVLLAIAFVTDPASQIISPNTDPLKWVDSGVLLLFLSIIYIMFMDQFNNSISTLIQSLKQSNEDLQEQDNLLKENLREKNILLQEVHHRVKNNLAVVLGVLQLQSYQTDNPETRTALMKGTNRILSISKVHEMLYQSDNFDKIPFKEYVDALSAGVFETMNEKQLTVHFNNQILVPFLDLNNAVPIGIILNELISNSLKHAFTETDGNEIAISIEQTESTVQVVYSDNGKGIEHFADAGSNSLGFTLISSLLNQIDATYSYATQGSFRLQFEFPAGTP